jgi:hypothetical protein
MIFALKIIRKIQAIAQFFFKDNILFLEIAFGILTGLNFSMEEQVLLFEQFLSF